MFNKRQTSLIRCPGGKAGSYTIPASVINIQSGAFSGCSRLSNVTIPDSVTVIEGDAFNYCASLASVTIPDSVTSIGCSAFTVCTSLTNVTIGSGVKHLGLGMFWGCTSLAIFGVQTNRFGFTVTWASDKVVVVEAADDLTKATWTPVSTNILTGGTSYFSDPEWTKYPKLLHIESPFGRSSHRDLRVRLADRSISTSHS